ncbi:MAG: pseudouridine synthase, partial [Acholeplasmatales bacterium]|nr:pseudouridine synthase [Acholeplasmatales bacterium]
YVDVTKGYYVRSMARDLGELLNGYGILKDLRRVRSGNYKIDDSIKLEDLTKDKVISIFDFIRLDTLNVKDYLIPLVKNGIALDERQIITDKPFYVNSKEGVLAIYEPVGNNKYKPMVLFGGKNGNN